MRLRFDINHKRIQNKFHSDKIGIFLASTCARYMDEYVPMDTGMLAQNFVVTPFQVEYTQPYAHYQFNGTHFNFSRDKHPLATAHWDEATSKAHGNQIAKEVTEYLRRL